MSNLDLAENSFLDASRLLPWQTQMSACHKVLPLFLPFLNSGVFMGRAMTSDRPKICVSLQLETPGPRAKAKQRKIMDLPIILVTIWVFPKIGVPQNGWFIYMNHSESSSPFVKVKSLQGLFTLATEVLRLYGDFADQVFRCWDSFVVKFMGGTMVSDKNIEYYIAPTFWYFLMTYLGRGTRLMMVHLFFSLNIIINLILSTWSLNHQI